MNVISVKGGKVHAANGETARPACAGTGYLRGTYKATDKAVTCTRCAKATAEAAPVTDDAPQATETAPVEVQPAETGTAPDATDAPKAEAPKAERDLATFDATGVSERECPCCHEVKPVKKFVTKNGTTRRYNECRTCRDENAKARKPARTFDAEGVTEHKCEGACGEVKAVTKFPTVSGHGPSKRGVECRTCRDARIKAAKASKGQAKAA